MTKDVVDKGNNPIPNILTRHRQSLYALTGIRFVAAYYVVFFHTRIPSFFDSHHLVAVGNIFRNGYLAVPLFFLLSGFILAYTYEGQISGRGTIRRFMEARFARIWPVYFLSLVLSTIPFFVLPRIGAAVAAFLMVQTWNPSRPDLYGTLNLMCWSVSVEAFFYVVFPWVQRKLEGRPKRQIEIFLLGMVVLCVLINSCSRTPSTPQHGLWAFIPLPVLHLSEFLSGVGLGNYFLRRLHETSGESQRGLLAGKGFLALGSGLLTYSAVALSLLLLCRPVEGRWTSLIMISFSALLFGLAAETTLLSRFLSTRPMLFGGAVSYSIYLMQFPVKDWGIALAEVFHIASTGKRMELTAALLPIAAVIMYTKVEDPVRRFLRSKFAALELRNSTRRNEKYQVKVTAQ